MKASISILLFAALLNGCGGIDNQALGKLQLAAEKMMAMAATDFARASFINREDVLLDQVQDDGGTLQVVARYQEPFNDCSRIPVRLTGSNSDGKPWPVRDYIVETCREGEAVTGRVVHPPQPQG